MLVDIILLVLLVKLNMFNGLLLGLWIAEVVIRGIINIVGLTIKIMEWFYEIMEI